MFKPVSPLHHIMMRSHCPPETGHHLWLNRAWRVYSQKKEERKRVLNSKYYFSYRQCHLLPETQIQLLWEHGKHIKGWMDAPNIWHYRASLSSTDLLWTVLLTHGQPWPRSRWSSFPLTMGRSIVTWHCVTGTTPFTHSVSSHRHSVISHRHKRKGKHGSMRYFEKERPHSLHFFYGILL